MARKKYDIGGINGNAYCIMGYVTTAMSQESELMGWNLDELKKAKDDYLADATSSDYNHLVDVSKAMVERINNAIKARRNKMRTTAIVGDTLRIVEMKGEPSYSGRVGVVELVDSIGQIHGSWGGCAIQPEHDTYEILEHA